MLHQKIESERGPETLQELQRKWARLREMKIQAEFKISDLGMPKHGGKNSNARTIDVLETSAAQLGRKVTAIEERMLAMPVVDLGDVIVLLDIAIARCDLGVPDVTDFERGRGDAAVKFMRELLRLAPAGATLLHTQSKAGFRDTWEAIAKAA